jgi:uncharacterized protein YyaL (SSP411 family)
MIEEIRGRFLPQRVVLLARPGADSDFLPILEGKAAGKDGARAYVCRNYACLEPSETREALGKALSER